MGDQTWTVRSALEWTRGYLERRGDENPRLSAEWLLSEACGLTRVQLYLDYERPLSAEEREVLRGYVARRGQGEPLQYIAGEAPFRYLTLKVRPGVLIPRPETEVLVSEALACLPPAARRTAAWNAESAEQEAAAVAALKEQLAALAAAQEEAGDAPVTAAAATAAAATEAAATGVSRETTALDCLLQGGSVAGANPDASDAAATPVAPGEPQGGSDGEGETPARDYYLVADICTGSGCVACAIASERPDTRVIAVDLAPEAVALARENAEVACVADAVRVLAGNLGDPVPERYLGRLDLVVSNPPYVPTAVLDGIPREVSDFEPALALDGGADGLDLFRPLVTWAARALRPGGAFACELHEGHLDEAAALAVAAGLVEARIVDDLAGRPRVLVARKPA